MRRAVAMSFLAVLLAALSSAVDSTPARSDAAADKAWTTAVKRGQELYSRPWVEGGKFCAGCHGPGPNKMAASRLKSWPKWDKTAAKVLTSQQKLNQMIAEKCGAGPLELGSEDLTALEAYVSTLR